MRVLVAPDKFKGCLTAGQVADAMARGVREACPTAEVTRSPIADGGDGFLDVVLTHVAGAKARRAEVRDALGRPRDARLVLAGATAYVEAAEAVSVTHQEPSPSVSLRADTTGVGQLVIAALDAGAGRIVVGLGGTASTDAGAGMLRALGVTTDGSDGRAVPPGGGSLGDVARVDVSGLDPRLADVEVVAAVDVDNPLLGPRGAVRVFGPQKGADAAALDVLESAIDHWHGLWSEQAGIDLDVRGGGAAGGLGAAFAGVLDATMVSGADLVLELSGVTTEVGRHDLVLTGEGCLDEQSLTGKGPHAVVSQARQAGVDVGAVVGRHVLTDEQVADLGLVGLRSLAAVHHDPFDQPARKVATETALLVSAWSAGLRSRSG